MPTTNAAFLKYLRGRVKAFADENSISQGRAFMLWYAIEGLRLDPAEAREAVSYDGPNDKCVDLFYVDEEAQRIVVAQGKYSSSGRYGAGTGELLTLYHTSDWLSQPETLDREGRPDLAEAARTYLDRTQAGYSVDFRYVYAGPTVADVERQCSLLNSQNQASGAGVSITTVNLSRLKEDHLDFIQSDTRIERETVVLASADGFTSRGPFGEALVVTLPGGELRRIYGTYGDRLFDRNVRLFLGDRSGSVNAGIRDTLGDPSQRKNFWAYNNGITFVCDRYEPGRDGLSVTLYNFSIVNGCQTTVSIGTASESSAGEARVLARFIACSDSGTVDSIIRFTNAQTPIRSWDIGSQDPTQRALKAALAAGDAPYFYELRRGEAKALTDSERKGFTRDGEFRIIQFDVLAQYLGAYSGVPTVAYASKRLLFTTHRATVFPDGLSPEKVILVWQAGRVATRFVQNEIARLTEQNDVDALRVHLHGGRLFVLAAMSQLLYKRNGPTFADGMTRENAGSHRTTSKLEKYARVAGQFYLQAIQESLGPDSDLSYLVRTQEGYSKVRRKVDLLWDTFSLSPDWVRGAVETLGG